MTPLPEQDDLDLAIQRYYAAEFDEDARIQTRSVGAAWSWSGPGG